MSSIEESGKSGVKVKGVMVPGGKDIPGGGGDPSKGMRKGPAHEKFKNVEAYNEYYKGRQGTPLRGDTPGPGHP